METMKYLSSFLILILSFFVQGINCHISHDIDHHLSRFRHRAGSRYRVARHKVMNPMTFGGDPSGKKDSTEAIQTAVDYAFIERRSQLLNGVNDNGGAQVYLAGGVYKISRPIHFPNEGGGNILMHGGTINASDTFPKDHYLIELHSSHSPKRNTSNGLLDKSSPSYHPDPTHPLDTYYEDITFRDLLLDCNYVANSILIVDSVRTRLENMFVIRFHSKGIRVVGGHETVITDSFLGQHPSIGGDPNERQYSGTAIELQSNDNTITDTTIFSANIGIKLIGAANMITGVHCYNKATMFGGVGIYAKKTATVTRVDNSYMDWTGITIEDPLQFHVTNGFFLGNAYILLKSVEGTMKGLNVVDTMFSGSGSTQPIITFEGEFKDIDQVVIDRNNVDGMIMKSTTARRNVRGKGKRWEVDFEKDLVFSDRIRHVTYSFYQKNGGAIRSHAISKISGNKVTIRSSAVVDAVVSVSVDQYSGPNESTFF